MKTPLYTTISALALVCISVGPMFAQEATLAEHKQFDKWQATPLHQWGDRQFLCEIDKNDRFVEAEIYGITYRKMIEMLATMANEKVTIRECPDGEVSLSFRDKGFYEAVHMFIVRLGYEIVKDGSGGYIIQKRPNQPLQGTPEKPPSSSTEPETRRP